MSFPSEPVQSDLTLIKKLRSSSVEFEKTSSFLFKKYKSYIYSVGKRYPSLTKEELQSAYHDAFHAVIKMIIRGTFDENKGSIGTLLHEIFHKKCIDQLRKNTNHKNEWARQLQELAPDLPAASIEFLSEIIEQDTFQHVLESMKSLKAPCKQLILDLDYWGFSPEEAAKRNGYKNGHSASQAKYRCLKALQKKIRMRRNG